MNIKLILRRMVVWASRNRLLYRYALHVVERAGAFVQRERQWLEVAATAEPRALAAAITTDLKVLSGPFVGLQYPQAAAVGSAFLAKIVGSYEWELHPLVQSLRSNGYSRIVDIGCAEGYYAVGLARLFPSATVYAYDTSSEARDLCRAMAVANGVADRVKIGATCTTDELKLMCRSERALIVSDCEGFEKQLFTKDTVEALQASDVLIEVHDFRDPTISESLLSAFDGRHALNVIRSISDFRRVRLFRSSPLESMSLADRTTILAELRPNDMEWFFFHCQLKCNEGLS